MTVDPSPRLSTRAYGEKSVLTPENLMREARRQRQLPDMPVPTVCLLDPDGDVVHHLAGSGAALRHEGWACYHSELWVTDLGGLDVGIVPCAVGGPYAVLVAEQLFASGCTLLISVTSAGVITPLAAPPYFVVIERAWRDEGTSGHYLPPSEWADLDPELSEALIGAFDELDEPVHRGTSWTTDAPFRETASAIESAAAAGAHAVEMEAASLYAYATATRKRVVCVAHVTNTMAVEGEDFEKGEDAGTQRILSLTAVILSQLLHGRGPS
jgi:uridine phosphorylase